MRQSMIQIAVLASLMVVSAGITSWSQVTAQSHNTCALIEQAGGETTVEQEAFDAVQSHLAEQSAFEGDVNIGTSWLPIWVHVKAAVKNPRNLDIVCATSKVSLGFDLSLTISGRLGSDTQNGSGQIEGHYTISADLDTGKVTVCVGDVEITELHLNGVNDHITSWLRGQIKNMIAGFCYDIPVLFIDHLSPIQGSPITFVSVFGIGFRQGSFPLLNLRSIVLLDGSPVGNTIFQSSTQLRFVPLIDHCGPHTVQVKNPFGILPASGGQLSNVVTFTIVPPCQSSGGTPGAVNAPPTANFSSAPANPSIGQSVQFTDQSTDPDGAADITSWLWEFSDGMTSSEKNHTHTFNSAGTFTVKLTVTDTPGHKNTMSKSVTVMQGGAGSAPPPPPPPPPSGGSLASFDTNNNNLIDDSELFAIIDAWIAGQIDDTTFFQAVDLWISQGPISSAGLSSPPFRLSAVTLTTNSTRQTLSFVAHGQGISAIGVEIFNLSGTRIFAEEEAGTQLKWNLRTQGGPLIANGVYLYVVRVSGVSGEALRSEVKKLVILK